MESDLQKFKLNGNYWNFAFRIVTWLLQLAVLGAVVWVKANFVTREEYQRDSRETLASLNSIYVTMQRVNDKLDGYERISKKDEELENRIRELEKNQWQRMNSERQSQPQPH